MRAILDIGKEMNITQELIHLSQPMASVYKSKFIFDHKVFTDILTGNQLICHEFSGKIIFDQDGSTVDNIFPNDTFVRGGQFAAYVKSYFYDQEKLINKKFTDSNTFTKTLGLGFRLEPEEMDSKGKRPVYYIKLTESLQCVRKTLLEEAQYQNIPFSLHDTIGEPYKHFQKHAKLQNRLQRMIDLLMKSINMQTVLYHALKEVKYQKYTRGATDIYNVESKAKETELKLDNLLINLSRIDV